MAYRLHLMNTAGAHTASRSFVQHSHAGDDYRMHGFAAWEKDSWVVDDNGRKVAEFAAIRSLR
jgi:hypothetical protein